MTVVADAPSPHYLRSPDRSDAMAIIGWLLGRPTRRRVLAALVDVGSITLTQLASATSMPVGTIDPILGVLAHVGVADADPPRGTATGPHPILYSVSSKRIGELKAATGIDLCILDSV